MDYRGLTIGDWLLDKKEGFARKVVQVTDVSFEGCGAGVILENGMDYEECEPIPLTREILKKNGFDVSDREVMYYYFTLEGNPDWQREYFALKQMYDKETKEPKGFSYFVCNVLTIFDYVHQLQHALRLVGLTKLADNFKV